jgi:hypothetical protein
MEKVQRTCRYGHGDLVRSDGLWSLEEVQTRDMMVNGLPSKGVVPTGRMFAAQLWTCRTCGYAEMADGGD